MNKQYSSRGLARFGVVVPVSNSNLEPDMMMLAPPGVSLHFTRAGGYDVDEIPDEHQMRQYSDTTLDSVIEDLRLCGSDIVLYGCTSATLAQGPAYDQRFRERIETLAGVPAVTAASALVEMMQKLGIKRFAFTSPYVASLNDLAVGYIEQFGMTCVSRYDAPAPMSNQAVAAASPEQIIETAVAVDTDEAEAIAISCTDYRATEAIAAIEDRLGKPVITSNLATLVSALSRLGIALADTAIARHLAVSRTL